MTRKSSELMDHFARRFVRRLLRIVRHRWLDDRDVDRALSPDVLRRVEQAVACSEQTHTGEIRICVEAGLPMSYLWRDANAHERALALFSKLRVWDTEHNNGVLIYLLLADRAIEVVADRGIAQRVRADFWGAAVLGLGEHLKRGDDELGLLEAVKVISALLQREFPLQASVANPNEFDDSVKVL